MSNINNVLYRGRGEAELYNYVSANGTLRGEIIKNTGDYVADVEIDTAGSNVVLKVNNIEFSSITNALNQLYPDLATNNAEGSEGSGNVANNVIGNYAILKHVVFGKVTLEDIVGPGSKRSFPRVQSVRKARIAVPKIKFEDRMLKTVGIDPAYGKGTLQKLLSTNKREYIQQLFNTLTVGEFANITNVEIKEAV